MPSLFLKKYQFPYIEHRHNFMNVTLTLQVFLETFKTNISWGSDYQDPQISLHVFTELFWLPEMKKDRFHESPQ